MYKDFAYIYDKLSFDIPYDFYAQNIKELMKKHKIKTDRMLELACGSGMLTKYFFDEFKSIDALDLSKEMLEVFDAKFMRNDVTLYQEDMTTFLKEDSYDLIVILLDSINYVLDENDLKRLFKNFYKNLKKGGLLVFDINSLYKMEEVFGDNSYIYEYEDIFYTWDNNREDDLIYMYLDFFLENEDGTYRRIKENQVQRIYRPDFIKNELVSFGFEDIETFDEDTFTEVKDNTQRILFKAIKK
ncbi:MAG: class I SAM-dependent methyltransferase [Anaerococcus sp.]|jgi:SAM-dependent methyltransferase|nr:class I SAM-dependent methyltransferase [Peptoniphilaceae bacterium]MDY3054703.1 class I SAM-dependent methyltransferase [Anaerococcus sp.]